MIFNYIRVSTVQQNTTRQLLNIKCDRVYEEKVSAKNADRPQLQAMLSNLREHDHVNVHELSRLARNTKDLLNIVEQIIEANASIHFHKENLHFDANNRADPFQTLMLTMLASISTFERDLMLERQREGIALAKAKNKYRGRVSRFTTEQVNELRKRFNDKTVNKSALAREFNMSRQHLYALMKTT